MKMGRPANCFIVVALYFYRTQVPSLPSLSLAFVNFVRIVGFVKVATWIFQGCSMYFSPWPSQSLRFHGLFKFLLRTKVVEWVKVLYAFYLLGFWQCLGPFARVISCVCECNVHICFCIWLWVWPEGYPPLGCLVGWLVSRWGTWLVNSHQLVVVALRPSRQCDRTLWSD